MSRWRQDPDGAAAEIVRRSLPDLELAGRCLVANVGEATAQAVRAAGCDVTHWSRRASDSASPLPWPPPGPFDVALLRLSKSKDEHEMNLHAVLSVLREGARLVLFGGNDEGIRSGIATLEALCGSAHTLATRGHGRIVRVVRQQETMRAPLRDSLAAWRREGHLPLQGQGVDAGAQAGVPAGMRPWVSYPGLFAAGALDEGTALMLTALPPLKTTPDVLDYGCGSGVIGAGLALLRPQARIDLIDADTAALLAAAENVPGARTLLGTTLQAAGSQRYDAILSNPPLHSGVAEDHGALESLMAQAPKHLKSGGVLQMVVQRRVPLGEALQALFSHSGVVAENGRFRVWRASSS